MASATPAASTPPNPSEVGWQFVPQYYTFVNKHPNRLHCFYTKASTFIHGTEGDDVQTAHGQQDIHNQITAIDFQDCKVFIDCVDAQASANGGIIVQVIGEMSNKGEPWRKFVQTFFLAEQPNGYYVLNDIFRFLKEDTVDEDEASAQPVTIDGGAEPTSDVSAPVAAPLEEEPEPAPAPVAEPLPESEAEVHEEPQVNGHVKPEPEVEPETVPEAEVEEPEAPTSIPEEEAPIETTEPVTAAPEPAAPAPPAPAPTNAAPPVAATPQQQPTPAATPAPPTPSGPPVPKTWANLAAANSKKWGTAVASESRGTSEAPSQPPPVFGSQRPVQAGPGGAGRGFPPQQQQQQQQQQRAPVGDKDQHPLYQQAMALPTPQCFVKGIVDPLTNAELQRVLTQRFGPVKELDVVRAKACAFLEFTTLDAARRAVIACLPPNAGGEGGIRIESPDGSFVRITVENRKERAERPASRPRGGGPPNGPDRGSFRGGRGGSMRGRGGPPPAGPAK